MLFGRIGCAALVLALAAPAIAAEPGWSQDPASGCRFVAPASLGAGPTFWTGACPGGKAAGDGMLRRRDGSVAGTAFFGTMKDGIPVIGIVDDQNGYRVGPFRDGDIGGNIEGQEKIDAFEAAMRGARAVATQYRNEKNNAAATYYDKVYKTLEMQIE